MKHLHNFTSEELADITKDRAAIGKHSARPMRHWDADDEDKPLGWKFWTALVVFFCITFANAYFGGR